MIQNNLNRAIQAVGKSDLSEAIQIVVDYDLSGEIQVVIKSEQSEWSNPTSDPERRPNSSWSDA